MSMNIIEEFQLQIHRILKDDDELKKLVKHIYFSLPKDAAYPFICLNYDAINKVMLHNIARLNIKFEALLFVKGFNPQVFNKIIEALKNALSSDQFKLNLSEVISIQNHDIEYQNASDFITHKITVKFTITLQGKIL